MVTNYLELSNRRKIAYRKTVGKQPGVVFLGGFSSDMEGTKACYMEQWARKQGISYLKFDYTGHGKSSGKFEDGCISDWLNDACDTISALVTQPQVMVGSSMGGWLSLLLARKHHKKVAGIVGIAAAPDFTISFQENKLSHEQLKELRERGLVRVSTEYADEGLIISERLINDGPKNFIFNQELNLSVPVRLLQGTKDADVDQSTAVRLLNHCSGDDVRLLLVNGADHSFSTPNCLEIIERATEEVLNLVNS